MPLKSIREPGRKYRQIVGTVAGRRIHKSAKTTSKVLADQKARALELELEQRAVHGPAAVMTFAQAVNIYLDAGNSGKFLAPLNEKLGRELMRDIRQSRLDEVAREIYPNVKPSTLNRQAYTPFIAVFNWVSDEIGIERRWRRPKGHDNRTKFRFLWPDEVQAVWQIMPPNWRAIVDFYCGTGTRETEGLELDWKNVSLAHAEAWINRGKTNAATRRLDLPARTVASLANLAHRSDRVHRNRHGEAFTLSDKHGGILRGGLEYYCNKAGVEPFTAHVMRHTWASWHYSWNKDVIQLKTLGGWRKTEMVERYTHLAPRNLRQDLVKHGWSFDGPEAERAANKVV